MQNLTVGVGELRPARITPGHLLFAMVMIALGIRGLVVGDFASVWQRIPIAHLPARQWIAYICALAELLIGMGLLWRRTLPLAAAVAAGFTLLWLVLLKLPAVLVVPQMEATWMGAAEIATILSGGWILFAIHAGSGARQCLGWAVGVRGIGWARLLFVLALPAIGLAHFAYADETAALIPAWLPGKYGWVYLTGAGSLVASLGLLFAVWPRLAAMLEAAMLSVITVLVWLPGLIAAPANASLTPFLMSSAIACGAWVVADSYRGMAWLSDGVRDATYPRT
ncbi:MAG: hypothetical protein ABI178_11160 [Rhodanobacter sp.]